MAKKRKQKVENISDLETEKRVKIKFIDKLQLRFFKNKTFLITMFYNNGTSKTFVLSVKDKKFKHKKKTYLINYEETWFNLTQRNYHFYYHENFCTPLNREIIPDNENDPYLNISPSNIKEVLKMEYVKVLATSQELSKYLKMSLVISGITMLGLAANAYFTYNLGR